MKIHQLVLVFLSLLCYLVSLPMNVFEQTDYIGIGVLFIGWMSILDFSWNGLCGFLAWSSNLVYFGAIAMGIITFFALRYLDKEISKARWFKVFSLVSGIFGSLLLLGLAAFSLGFKEVLINEGGTKVDVVYAKAYYVWLGSYILMVLSNITIKK